MIHGFRKFFATQLENSDVSDFHNEALMGHAVGLRAIYRVTPEKRLAEYVKAVNNLTISEENRLRIKINTIEEKDKEISKLRQELYQTDEGLRGQLAEKDIIMQKAIDGIQLLMKQREEDSKRIAELEGLIAKVLPMGKKLDATKEELDKVRSRLKEVVKTNE